MFFPFSQLVKRMHSSLGIREEILPCPGKYDPTKTLSGKPEVGEISLGNDCLLQEMKCKQTENVFARIERRVVNEKLMVNLTSGDIVATEVYHRIV